MIWYICMWVEKTATQTTQVFNKLFVRKKRERRRFLEDIDVYLHPHTYTPFLYPFICQQALRLSQHLGYRREYWLQWIWECRYFFETIILWPLDLYSETGLLDHTVVLLLIFWGTSKNYSSSGSYSSSTFNFLRHLHTVFHCGCTNLHSHWQHRRVPYSPHSCQTLLSFVFLTTDILTGVRWWYLPFWYTYWSAMSSKKNLIRSFAQFFFFCHWVVQIYYIFWKLTPYQVYYLQTFFPMP